MKMKDQSFYMTFLLVEVFYINYVSMWLAF